MASGLREYFGVGGAFTREEDRDGDPLAWWSLGLDDDDPAETPLS